MTVPANKSLPAMDDVCVCAHNADPGITARASTLADQLGLPLTPIQDAPARYRLAVVVTDQRLELRVYQGDTGTVGGKPVHCDLTALDTTSGPGRSLSLPLFKAAGIKRRNRYRPDIIDATAGLGEDAWLLASAGCSVRTIERSAITSLLFEDGLQRARKVSPDVASRVQPLRADSIEFLRALPTNPDQSPPDVVYLDPMFPTGRKTAERKAMRVLRSISGDDHDSDTLLAAALSAAVKRVVVKRPRHAPPIAGPTDPSVVHKGKSLRFDVYLTANQ